MQSEWEGYFLVLLKQAGNVGLEIDGPVGSDSKLLGIGRAMEEIVGRAPPPRL